LGTAGVKITRRDVVIAFRLVSFATVASCLFAGLQNPSSMKTRQTPLWVQKLSKWYFEAQRELDYGTMEVEALQRVPTAVQED